MQKEAIMRKNVEVNVFNTSFSKTNNLINLDESQKKSSAQGNENKLTFKN